jgi:hypothetical protein
MLIHAGRDQRHAADGGRLKQAAERLLTSAGSRRCVQRIVAPLELSVVGCREGDGFRDRRCWLHPK